MDIARNWRLKKQRYTLDKQTHSEGVMAVLTPSPRTNGHSEAAPARDSAQVALGEIYSFTKVFDAPAGYEDYAPYTVALVKLDDGRMITTQLTDLGTDAPEIGMKVEMVTRKLRNATDERGMLIYGYKFRPILQ